MRPGTTHRPWGGPSPPSLGHRAPPLQIMSPRRGLLAAGFQNVLGGGRSSRKGVFADGTRRLEPGKLHPGKVLPSLRAFALPPAGRRCPDPGLPRKPKLSLCEGPTPRLLFGAPCVQPSGHGTLAPDSRLLRSQNPEGSPAVCRPGQNRRPGLAGPQGRSPGVCGSRDSAAGGLWVWSACDMGAL